MTLGRCLDLHLKKLRLGVMSRNSNVGFAKIDIIDRLILHFAQVITLTRTKYLQNHRGGEMMSL